MIIIIILNNNFKNMSQKSDAKWKLLLDKVFYDCQLDQIARFEPHHVSGASGIQSREIRGLDLDQSGITGRSEKRGTGFHAKSHKPAELSFRTKWDFSVRILRNSVFFIRFILLPSSRIFILTSNQQTGVKWRKNIISGHCVTNTIEQLPSTLQLNLGTSSPALRFCCR